MEIDDKPIKEFVKKHKMNYRDEIMQAKVIEEEALELIEAIEANTWDKSQEEAADVMIATLIFAELNGWLDMLPDMIAEKMKENLEKPVGRKPGEKVRKA